MPPLPFSSSGGGVVVVVSVGVVVVSVVVVGFGRGRRRGLGGRAGRRLGRARASFRLGLVVTVEVVPLSPLLAITTTAITRPTITAIRPATSRRMLPCGLCRPGPVVGLAHHPGRVLVHWLTPPVRVSRRGSRSVSSISKPLRRRCRDLLPAAAGDRHLGREQAGPGGAARAPLGRSSVGAAATGSATGSTGRRGGGSTAAARRRCALRRVELVGEGAQALGDDAVGPAPASLELPPGLLLGVVDHLRPRPARPPRRSRPGAPPCWPSAARGSGVVLAPHPAASLEASADRANGALDLGGLDRQRRQQPQRRRARAR